jgi:hypothetical protein
MKDLAKMSQRELRMECAMWRERPEPDLRVVWWTAYLIGSLTGIVVTFLAWPLFMPV